MNLYSTIWRFVIILLCFSIKFCPLLPAGCQRFNGCGSLTVEPSPSFLLGSNLTVYCNIAKCEQRSIISLELNGEMVRKKVNSTTMKFNFFNVQMPLSIVRCRLQSGGWSEIVGGLDLQGGLPPDKPENITCETSMSSDFIDCSWERGQETHLHTAYNISVTSENGTQILFDQIQDAEKITIPRARIEEDTKYQLTVTAYNHFRASSSDPVILCVKDIMIPETPNITHLEFENNSMASLLQWKTTESSQHLRSFVRLRTDNGPWAVGEATELSEGLIRVDGLKPLTEYEFQMRTCYSSSGLTHTITPSERSFCSKWSPSVRTKSPKRGPSKQLHVWRMLGSQGTNGLWMVTVLWKPPPPDDYSGEVQQYKIFVGNDHKQKMTCGAALSQCLVQVPAEVQALSISAVTSYGASPPADVPLRQSGDSGPVLRGLAPAANGSAVMVSWSWHGNKHWSKAGGELLHYVLEWTSVPVAELRWQKLTKDQHSTSIIGLAAGVRYNISLYAVTTRGVSASSSALFYSKEQKPVFGPNMSVLVHEARRIWIQWDELPVNQQRGFITNYTIYLQTLDSSNTEVSVTVSASNPRQKWLDCPEATLALQVTASTSAGEGPPGSRISSQPATPAVGLVIVIVIIIILSFIIIANLMCWSCVRKRIKKKCISWRPAWFDGNLPELGNSIAIKLLEQDRSDPPVSSTYSDPPLSPISLISQEERDDMYPNVHVQRLHRAGSGQPTAEKPLLTSDPGTIFIDSQLEHVSYKPQIATWAAHGQEVMETGEQQLTNGEEEEARCSSGGLLGGFLSSAEVDFSDSPLGPTLSSVSGHLWPKTPELSVWNGGFLLESRGPQNVVEADSPSLDSQQGGIMTRDTADTCLSRYTVETTLTGGYFPQVATVSSVTLCDR